MIARLLAALIALSACSGVFAQAPQIGSGQVFGNSTAAQRNGRSETVTAILDRAIGSTRGSIMYRGVATWSPAAPGTSGLPWVSNGAGADPAYQALGPSSFASQTANTFMAAPNGSAGAPTFRAIAGADLPNPGASSKGGVQSLTCSASNWFNTLSTSGVLGCSQPSFAALTGSLACTQTPALTGDVATSAGACATTLATVNSNVGAFGSSTSVPTITLDAKGRATAAAQTAIPTASAATLGLAKCDNTTITCASGNFSAVTSAGTPPPPGGRLSLVSGSCEMTTDTVAAATVYYAPCLNQFIPIYNGTAVQSYSFIASTTDAVGLSLALGSSWTGGTLYDVFVSLNGGSPVLCTVAWTSSGAGTSARASALGLYNGLTTNAGAITCRISNASTIAVPANQATYVGTMLTATAAGTVDFRFGTSAIGGGYAVNGLWNAYNRVNGAFFVVDSNPSFVATAATTYQAYDSGATGSGLNNRVYLVSGTGNGSVSASMQSAVGNFAAVTAYVGVGLNVANAMWQRCASGYAGVFGASGSIAPITSSCSGYMPAAGMNFLQAILYAQNTSVTFYGGTSPAVSGLAVNWSW
jgi:hypothetical protein